MIWGKRGAATQFGGGHPLLERRPRFNPDTQGSRQGTTIRAGHESIPDGWSITGTTYRSTPEGGHDATLLHIRPETAKQSLAGRAAELHEGWTPDLPQYDVGPKKIFEGGDRRAVR